MTTVPQHPNQEPKPLEYLCAFIIVLILIVFIFATATSCSPKIIEHVTTKIEYRDRIITDTATVEIEKIVEKNVTLDTLSLLENKYAKSEAVVSKGLLHHSLESIPQIIKVPVTVHVTDTLWKESEVIEKEVKVEKELNWWQKFRLDAFWWLAGLLVLSLLWIFRKVIF